MKKIFIIGGGLTGLSVAYFLEQSGIQYTLIEKEHSLGGLCKTVSERGYKFDFTGHLLHLRSDRIKNFIFNELNLKNALTKKERKSKIYMLGRFINYPFQANINQLPKEIAEECIEGFIAREHNTTPVTFEDWIKKYFGNGMGKYFFYPYNEKLWKRECDRLLYEWTGRYVPKIKLGDITNPVTNMGYNGFFYYPEKDGIGILIKSLERSLNKQKIITGERVISVDYGEKIIKTEKELYKYDILINTSPLNDFLNLCSVENRLTILSVLNINIGFEMEKGNDIHWVYFPEKQFPFYRVGYYSHFNGFMAPPGKDSIYIEISHTDGIDMENGIMEKKRIRENRLLNNVISQLESICMIKGDIDIVHINDIKNAYVIYDFYRKNNLDKFLRLLRENSIYSIGRYGAWSYNSMEDNIIEAWETVKEIKRIL